jgi:hypothetical protein
VQKAPKEVWWLVNSCSPPLGRGEHVVFQQKLELKMLEQWYRLGRRRIQEVVDRSYVLQGVGAGGHSFQVLRTPLEGFL